MKIKAIIQHTHTKSDLYGNIYHTCKIINPKTAKSFTTKACCLGNVESILYDAFPNATFSTSSTCTNSSRSNSLPNAIYLNECRLDDEWRKELRKIGYRLKRA